MCFTCVTSHVCALQVPLDAVLASLGPRATSSDALFARLEHGMKRKEALAQRKARLAVREPQGGGGRVAGWFRNAKTARCVGGLRVRGQAGTAGRVGGATLGRQDGRPGGQPVGTAVEDKGRGAAIATSAPCHRHPACPSSFPPSFPRLVRTDPPLLCIFYD